MDNEYDRSVREIWSSCRFPRKQIHSLKSSEGKIIHVAGVWCQRSLSMGSLETGVDVGFKIY